MKKLSLLLAFSIAVNCFSQAITVNTSTYSVPQLVNTVLINSLCASATNITSKTGTNFGSSNGIGYFQNTNPNFPIKNGVILSTGNAQNAVGPNFTALNDGANNWPGDSALENTMTQAGITMNSINATVLEFDFTPISPSFSFQFLFASEEYGNFQCQFSDAFAFLLTNTATGVTTNLAIVPNTTTPISVTTIRDYLYNSKCPSANAQYFGSYNGASAAAGSATNFNGQTKLLNASATLVPNTPYHIKLVIADRTDSGSDSAIFIASDTFNIGQNVLGLDLTVADNTAICFGTSHILSSGLNPADYTLSWKKDGVPKGNGANLTISQPGNYSITYQNKINGCPPETDFLKVEYFPMIVTKNPINLSKCDIGSPTYLYDLSLNTPIVKTGLDPLTVINYYASIPDANAGINVLPTNYTSAPGQTVYVRINNSANSCFTVKSFKLLTSPAPIANKPPDITQCAIKAGTNTSQIQPSKQNPFILNGQSATSNIITYYTSISDANTNTNPLGNVYTGIDGTIIYARIENSTDTSCFSTTSFKLIVNPLPEVDKLLDVEACDKYLLMPLVNGNYSTKDIETGNVFLAGDAVLETTTMQIINQPDGPLGCAAKSTFKITIIDAEKLTPKSSTHCENYTLPALEVGKYFTLPGGKGTEIKKGTVITTTTTINFYYKAKEEPFCEIDEPFTVTIIPIENVGIHPNVFDCTSYRLPPLTAGNYYTQDNGGGSMLAPGTVITTSQTVYVYNTNASDPLNICVSKTSFEIFIGINTPPDISQCEGYPLPDLPIGNYYTLPSGAGTLIPFGTIINDTQTIYIYVPNGNVPNCTDTIHFVVQIAQPQIDVLNDITACDNYTLPLLAKGAYYTETNGAGTLLKAGDIITSSQTIYIFKRSIDCNNESSFKVTINKSPLIDSRALVESCNNYVLTPLTVGDYYTGPGGSGTKLSSGTVINTSQKIYIYAVSKISANCTSENSFDIILYSIEADQPADVSACDSYTLPALKVGNYYDQPGDYSSGDVIRSGTAGIMHAGDVITTTKTLYIYTESGERINCTDENSFVITINKSPIIGAVSDVNVCNSYTLPKLALGDYYTQTGGAGTLLKEGDIITSTQTLYVYAQTATTPNCTDEKSFKVTIFNVDELPDITICEGYTLPQLKIGNYYTGSNGTGTILNSGEVVKSFQTIYIYSLSPFSPTCNDQSDFVVTIVDTPIAFPVPSNLTTVCDYDGTNDGITIFNLTPLSSTILGSQTSAEFTIQYYAKQADAIAQINPIVSTDLKTIFVRVSNTLTPNCFDIKSIAITVKKLPVPNPKGGIICYDSKTSTLLNPYIIPSGLSAVDYTFKWLNETGVIMGTNDTYNAILPGTYTLIATDNQLGCVSDPISVEVSPSEPAVIGYSSSDYFLENQMIVVEANGVGGFYEYQLDSGVFQDSPVFQNVPSGTHTITVRDKNGCGNSVTEALIVNYPKFFTPNGDGYNDTWNIYDLKEDMDATIYIFDRYGKLLSQIKPSGHGWDGSYNNQNMPSSDYWFTINYLKFGVLKEFKSHFSMKR
ncbi:T9SS type B sorting domain-containing protein [Flavobacterium psychrotolerans]|uniref:Adhesin n=1 Tax=Flavobacterium psychrotolerans TaxID=2169410 RepID=A0A2U1JQT7_9FLAO|nr:choice-of-anchor L domain-containing protein [Flavobacterium psychrotolerans]PWA07253.1 adhesin [Flavobacterium psychrotolerans]